MKIDSPNFTSFKVRLPHQLAEDMERAASVLRSGRLVAFPTETVYGLGADARNEDAVARIFAVKGRPTDHPLIVHLGDIRQLAAWARDVPQSAWRLADAFWPGPLTLILPRLAGVSDTVTGGLDTVALRVPGHPVALALLAAFGDGVAAPSANRYGRVSPTSAEDVREELGQAVDLIIDGGRCAVGIESTILDMTCDPPRMLRPGPISESALQRVLGCPLGKTVDTQMRSPGLKPSHYAPRARVILASTDNVAQQVQAWREQDKRVGVLAPRPPDHLPDDVTWLHFTGSLRDQAHALYSRLREADHLGLQVLVAVMPDEREMGHALCDRLRRAAGLGEGGDPMVQSPQISRSDT